MQTVTTARRNGASDNREALKDIVDIIMNKKEQSQHPAFLCPKHDIEATIRNVSFSATFDYTYASGCICAGKYPHQAFDWSSVDMHPIKSKEHKYCGEMRVVVQEPNGSGVYCPVYSLLPRSKATLKKNLQPTMGKGVNLRLSKSNQHYLPLLIDRSTDEVLVVLKIALANQDDLGSGVRIAKNRCHFCIAYQVDGNTNIFNGSGDSITVEIGIKKSWLISQSTNFKIIYTASPSEISNKRNMAQCLCLYAAKMAPYHFLPPQSIWPNQTDVYIGRGATRGSPYLEEGARYSQLGNHGENELAITTYIEPRSNALMSGAFSSLSKDCNNLMSDAFSSLSKDCNHLMSDVLSSLSKDCVNNDDESQSCDSRIPTLVSDSYSEEALVESNSSVDLNNSSEDLSLAGIALDVSLSSHEICPNVDDIMNPFWLTISNEELAMNTETFTMGNHPFAVTNDAGAMNNDVRALGNDVSALGMNHAVSDGTFAMSNEPVEMAMNHVRAERQQIIMYYEDTFQEPPTKRRKLNQ